MDIHDVHRIRSLFQAELSSQRPEIREFLDKIFADVAFDQQDFMEIWQTWHRFEGWITSHGLEEGRQYV